jgi:hypothetical protein
VHRRRTRRAGAAGGGRRGSLYVGSIPQGRPARPAVRGRRGHRQAFVYDPRTGVTHELDLGGASLVNGDGMLLAGRVLFVVQNVDNKIAVVVLSRSLDRGRVVATLTDPDFDVPTTTDPQPAHYEIVRVG